MKMEKNETLKSILGYDMMKVPSNDVTVNAFLEKLDITDFEPNGRKTHYNITDNRYTCILTGIEKATGTSKRILIDIILGKPTYQQMMDVTFDRGKDCEKRVVLYCGLNMDYYGSNGINDKYMAKSFAQINNDFGIDTYIVRTTPWLDKFQIEEKPDGERKRKTNYSKHPSKKDFKKAELWLYYDEVINCFDPPPILDPDSWIYEGGPGYIGRDGLWVTTDWESNGLYMYVVADKVSARETLDWLMKNKKEEINEHFEGCKVIPPSESDKEYRISIRFDDKPFSVFPKATNNEKLDYAENVVSRLREFNDFFDELIEDAYVALKEIAS